MVRTALLKKPLHVCVQLERERLQLVEVLLASDRPVSAIALLDVLGCPRDQALQLLHVLFVAQGLVYT